MRPWEKYQGDGAAIEPKEPFELLHGVLTRDDIAQFTLCCKELLASEDSIPSYALIDHQDLPAYVKVKALLEHHLKVPLYYLNDFYLYTDNTFTGGWHMDTELFTFARALNAWILLSPDEVTDPVCFIPGINENPERYYHTMKVQDDDCTFHNLSNGKKESVSLRAIEADRTGTPKINLGDVLLLNPRRFHRTNVEVPKHSIVIKFLYADDYGLLSTEKVPDYFWSEVAIFSNLVKKHGAENWNGVLDGIREQLATPKGRGALSAGFWPEKIALFKRMVATLP